MWQSKVSCFRESERCWCEIYASAHCPGLHSLCPWGHPCFGNLAKPPPEPDKSGSTIARGRSRSVGHGWPGAGSGGTDLANWYFDNHNWPKAIEQYQKAISLGLDNADLRTDLGSAYRFSGQSDRAIEQYEIAQRENPEHENSLFNLAALYLQSMHNPAKASELLEDFRTRFPKSGALPRVQELLAEAKAQMSNSH